VAREFNKIDTGTLGDNRFKDSERHPDLTGKLETMSAEVIAAIAAGKPVRLAGWWKDGRDGQFLSLRVSLMRERSEATNSNNTEAAGEQRHWPAAGPNSAQGTVADNMKRNPVPSEDFDDDIPF
jgi:hypothetical protein